MKSGSEFEPLKSHSILIVGDPGSRKTTLALQFPRPYIFDADGNMGGAVEFLGLKDFYYDLGFREHGKKEEIPPPLRYQHMIECINAAAAADDVDTIILDSLTTIVDIVISEVKRQQKVKDDAIMRIQDWGGFLYLMKRLITKLKTTDKIIVATVHNKLEKDESDGRWKHFLAIPGQTATIIAGLFTDCINVYCKSGNNAAGKKVHEFRIRTLPINSVDHRGIKSSLNLGADIPYSTDFIKKLVDRNHA